MTAGRHAITELLRKTPAQGRRVACSLRGQRSNPFIVQIDLTVLREVDWLRCFDALRRLWKFTEPVKMPEHVHPAGPAQYHYGTPAPQDSKSDSLATRLQTSKHLRPELVDAAARDG